MWHYVPTHQASLSRNGMKAAGVANGKVIKVVWLWLKNQYICCVAHPHIMPHVGTRAASADLIAIGKVIEVPQPGLPRLVMHTVMHTVMYTVMYTLTFTHQIDRLAATLNNSRD